MLFLIAIVIGFIGLVLLVVDPMIGIGTLVFALLIAAFNRNRQNRAITDQRHREMLEAMKK